MEEAFYAKKLSGLYQQALESCPPDERMPMRRGRLFILGEGRVGKSTMLKAILGLPFDPHEASTEVFDMRAFELGYVEGTCVVHHGGAGESTGGLSKQTRALLAARLSMEKEGARQIPTPSPSPPPPPPAQESPPTREPPTSSSPPSSTSMTSPSDVDDEVKRHMRLAAINAARERAQKKVSSRRERRE